jgi:integrase
MPKLTKSLIDALNTDNGKPSFVWDTLAGFGVKALPTGKKVFVVKYRTNGGGRNAPQRWQTLGKYGALTLDQARQMATQILADVARGADPQGNKLSTRAAPRMQEVWDRFETDELPSKKPATQRDYKAQWQNVIKPKFGNTLVRDVNRGVVEKFHKDRRGTPYQANRILALLSRLMNMAERWEWRIQGTNPCRYVERFEEKGRERYLSIVEIGHISAAIYALTESNKLWPEAGNAIKLLLLTAARVTEITQAKWKWVDFDRQVLALPDSKTGSRPIYLSPAAIDLLKLQRVKTRDKKSDYVFPGRSQGKPLHNLRKPWGRVCAAAKIEGVRLHDLRHTAASIAAGQGISLPVIGRLLGHSQAQTTQRYAHVDSDPALFAANLIGEFVGAALNCKPQL